MTSESTTPLEWIRLECVPLPNSKREGFVVYWNPSTREIWGDQADWVLEQVRLAMNAGHIKGATLSHFEISDPLTKPSELAAILAQEFWVIPQPVATPGLADFEPPKNLQ